MLDRTEVFTHAPVLARRFEIISILGEGASGSVFHARDRARDNREVALKVLFNKSAFDDHTLERFRSEFEVLQEIRHRNIVAAYDLVTLENTIAYTMEYIKGEDLGKVTSTRTFTPEELDAIFIDLLDAVTEVHRHGIFHRDIKLENIMLAEDGTVKLTDFGLMKREAAKGLTKTGILLGTAQYMPPEYLRFSSFDARSELYTIGLVLYELLTKSRWLYGMSGNEAIAHLLENNFEIPLRFPEGVPQKYIDIVRHSITREPRHRFQSPDEMKEAFRGKPIRVTNSSVIPTWPLLVLLCSIVACVSVILLSGRVHF